MFLSHSGARFGSFSISRRVEEIRWKRVLLYKEKHTAGVFIRPVIAVLVSVAEKTLVDADGVTTRELPDLTEGFICAEQRLNLPLLGQLVTVLHSPLPITRLLLQVKRQTRGASDGLQALEKVRLRDLDFRKDPLREAIN